MTAVVLRARLASFAPKHLRDSEEMQIALSTKRSGTRPEMFKGVGVKTACQIAKKNITQQFQVQSLKTANNNNLFKKKTVKRVTFKMIKT